MEDKLEITYIDINKLNPAPYNPRKISPEALEKLKNVIKNTGLIDPLIARKSDLLLIGGHQRLKACKELKYKEVPVVLLDCNDSEAKAINIALNNPGIQGEYDMPLLKDLLQEIDTGDFNMDLTGFDSKDLETLMTQYFNDEINEDEFDVDSELKKPAVSHLGDIWMLGQHRLVCGDSTNADTFTMLMDGKTANLVVTDPPYNVNYEGSAGKIKNDNMNNEAFYDFLLAAFTNTEAAMSKDASIYVFHADIEGLNFRKAFSDAGFHLSGTCIWKKQSLVLGRSPYQWQHEPVLFGWKKKGKHLWYSDRKQTTIWEFEKPKKSADHPTMKPVALVAYPIMNSSLTNCIILDPFGGSGSTLIACEQTNRICYMMELDEKYCDIIIKRWETFTNKKAELIENKL